MMGMVQTKDSVIRKGPFSPEEDAFILANADKMTALEMGLQMGRWQASVSDRLRKLRGERDVPTASVTSDLSVGEEVLVDRRLSGRGHRRDVPPVEGKVYYVHPRYVVVQFEHYRESFDYGQVTKKEVRKHAKTKNQPVLRREGSSQSAV